MTYRRNGEKGTAMGYYRIVYYSTLYHRDVTVAAVSFEVKENYTHFSAGGHKYMVENKHIKSIKIVTA